MKNFAWGLLLFTVLSYSQTTTKKYNDLMNRYEYYNSSGQMIGYEKYNSLMQQWEYTDLSKTVSPRVHDYGKPQSTFDTDLAIQALSARQSQYNKNQSLVENVITNASKNINIKLLGISNENKRYDVLELFNLKMENYFDKNSNNINANNIYQVENHIYLIYEDALKEVNNSYNKETNTKTYDDSKNSPKFKYGDYVKTTDDAPIRSEANLNSNIIKRSKSEVVKIIKSVGENYYEVELSGLTGFISVAWLREKESKISYENNTNSVSLGGYTANGIIEYKWISESEKFELDKNLSISSKVYLSNDSYAFKRGSDKWLYANWTYSGYDEKNKVHIYYDNYGQNLAIDLENKTITWFTDRKNGLWTKAIKYTNLTKNDSVKPQ